MPSRVDLAATLTISDESQAERDVAEPRPTSTLEKSSAPLDRPAPPAPPLPEEAEPGRILADRYRLVERLGAGAHGEVWAVDDLVLHTPAALKWMRRHGSSASLARIR